MSKLGLKKGTVHDRAADEQVAHVHIPGRAYNVSDPITKLIHTIGGGFFNEPKYYDTSRSYVEFMVELLTKRKVHVDRIIFLSDLCCYTQGDDGTAQSCGVNMEEYFGKKATMQSMVDKYRQCVNPACFVYSVNLSGHGQSQLRPSEDRTHLLSGWSEKLLDLIRDLEAGKKDEQGQKVEVPAIEVLQRSYQR